MYSSTSSWSRHCQRMSLLTLGPMQHKVGLYELVAASNPSVGEEVGMEAVLDAATERRLGLDAAKEAVAQSKLGVDSAATIVCASLPPARCRGAA
jgi:hypothetical protein